MRKMTPYLRRNHRFEISVSILFLAGMFLFVVGFILKENFIYYWDYAHYWYKLIEFLELFSSWPPAALDEFIYSIRYHEYNLVAVLFLLPFEMLFGVSRLSYICSITLIYTFPFILLFSYFFRKSFEQTGFFHVDKKAYLVALVCLGLSPQLWSPVLLGYPGIGGLIPIIGVLLIYSSKRFEELSYLSILFMALLLCMSVLFRRWYAYWVVGFLVSITVVEIVGLMAEYRGRCQRYLPVVLRLLTLGCGSFLLFLLAAGPMAIIMLTTDYSDIYSGYKFSGSFPESLKYLRHYFGSLILMAAVIGSMLSLLLGGKRKVAAVLVLQFWISMILFTRTQDFGRHHYYILFPAIYFFGCFFITVFLSFFRSTAAFLVGLVQVVIVLVINFSIVLVPFDTSKLDRTGYLFPRFRHHPLQRDDIGEIYSALEYLDKLKINEDRKVYVLASGHSFNEDIVRFGCRGETGSHNFCDYIATTAHVDKRDGLPLDFLVAKYVVTTDKTQLHLAPKDQHVVTDLHDLLVAGKGIGKNYEKLEKEFILDKDLKVLIYKRSQDKFNEDDLKKLENDFSHIYPGMKQKFMIPPEMFEKLTMKKKDLRRAILRTK